MGKDLQAQHGCVSKICKGQLWQFKSAGAQVNTTFQGQADPYFLGLIPVLNIFDELESRGPSCIGIASLDGIRFQVFIFVRQGSLAANSNFINDLRAILLDTKAASR